MKKTAKTMKKKKDWQTKEMKRKHKVLFVALPTPNYPKILQIKRRYSIIHSDE